MLAVTFPMGDKTVQNLDAWLAQNKDRVPLG